MNVRAIALSLALGAAPLAAVAQGAQTPSQEANPHDTKNKDRGPAPKGTAEGVRQGESANPHSTEYAKPQGTATGESMEKAQEENPHSVRAAKAHNGKTHTAKKHHVKADAGTPDAG